MNDEDHRKAQLQFWVLSIVFVFLYSPDECLSGGLT